MRLADYRVQALDSLTCRRRVLLSGTPIQARLAQCHCIMWMLTPVGPTESPGRVLFDGQLCKPGECSGLLTPVQTAYACVECFQGLLGTNSEFRKKCASSSAYTACDGFLTPIVLQV